MHTIAYTGPTDAVCPITFKPLHEMEHPVVFVCHPGQPYEAEALAQWLRHSRVIPHSNVTVAWKESPVPQIVRPLSEPWGSAAGAARIFEMFENVQTMSVQPQQPAAVFQPPPTEWQLKVKTSFWLVLFGACLLDPIHHMLLGFIADVLEAGSHSWLQQCSRRGLDVMPMCMRMLFLVHTVRCVKKNYPLNGLLVAAHVLFVYLVFCIGDKHAKRKPWLDAANTWEYHADMISLCMAAAKFSLDFATIAGGYDVR